VLQTQHLQEMADRRRADSVEMRLAITTHCQLEAGAVDALLIRDLEGFATELRARMATECELHLSRERAGLLQEVDASVGERVAAYRHEVAAEEQQAVMERRKALAGKLAVLERQGLLRPETKAQYERLRREMKACSKKLEVLGESLQELAYDDELELEPLVPDWPPYPERPKAPERPPMPERPSARPVPMSPDEEEDYPRRESPSLLENTSPNAQSFGDLLPKREKLVVSASYEEPRVPTRPTGPPARPRTRPSSLPRFGSVESFADSESDAFSFADAAAQPSSDGGDDDLDLAGYASRSDMATSELRKELLSTTTDSSWAELLCRPPGPRPWAAARGGGCEDDGNELLPPLPAVLAARPGSE